MRSIVQIASAVALATTLLPSVVFLTGWLELFQVKTVMLVATVVWFVATARAAPWLG